MIIFGIVSILYTPLQFLTAPPPYPLSMVSIIGAIIGIVTLYGISLWKKWGIYLRIFTSISAIYLAIALTPSYTQIAIKSHVDPKSFLGDIILILIGDFILWIWAISRKWSYFE